jgi:hypothetical protein
MVKGVDPKGLQAIEIDFLDVEGRGFDNHLILIIVLEPVGILSVSAIGRSPRGLNIGHSPRLRTQGPEKGGRMKGPGTYLHVIGLLDNTSLICPESLQGKDQFLKIHLPP